MDEDRDWIASCARNDGRRGTGSGEHCSPLRRMGRGDVCGSAGDSVIRIMVAFGGGMYYNIVLVKSVKVVCWFAFSLFRCFPV